MLLSTIVDSVRVELQDQAGALFPDADLIALATESEQEFTRETRVYETWDQLSTVAGEWQYQLPANWIGAKALFTADLDSAGTQTWVRLAPSSLEKTAQECPNFLSDQTSYRNNPRRYWVDQMEVLFIFPRPLVASTIQMYFVATPPAFTALTDSIHIPSELSNAIKYYLLAKCSAKDQDPENEAKHWANWQVMLKKGHKWRNRRQLDERKMLGDLDTGRPFSGGYLNGTPSIANPLGM